MGCARQAKKTIEKAPRPVSVMTLKMSNPSDYDEVTGLVGSWKTEDIGFEVSGRIQFVTEPERDVDGEVFKIIGEISGSERPRVPLAKGSLLAKLDDTRYRYTVDSVKAQIETSVQRQKSAEIEATKVLPAEREAALADLAFAKSEVDRNRPLVESRAISKAELDRVLADYASAAAKLAQVEAAQLAKEAEVESLGARTNQLRGDLAQAELDLADCELRSPFRGQVAKVHVIPGGVIQAGQPVVTVQMMDPIKIDLEVSAATSQRLKYRDALDVTIPQPQAAGSLDEPSDETAENIVQRGIVYTIDPVADPVTRTFTVTMLMRNHKVQSPPPPDYDGPLARVRDVWRLLDAPYAPEGPDADASPSAGKHFVDEKSIHKDGEESYVWKVENWDDVETRQAPVLKVSKVKVIPGDLRMDWMGLWVFREVSVAAGEDFDVERDVVLGNITSAEPFQGDRVLWDWQRWMVRPGDLVTVSLSSAPVSTGFFVPMATIRVQGDKSFVFIVKDGEARQVQVNSAPGPDTLRRITPVNEQDLREGMQLISKGVHYLVDGEAVNVVRTVQVGS